MNIHINAFDTQSLDRAIKQLQDYQKGLEEKAQTVAQRLADIGMRYAQVIFENAPYDGIKDNAITVDKTEKGYSVKASGQTVLFIEFGAGVTYPDDHPQAAEFGMVHGTYGKGNGAKPTWGFYGEEPGTNGRFATNADGSLREPHVVLTHGNPAVMPMYNAEQEIKSNIERIVKEVFSGD